MTRAEVVDVPGGVIAARDVSVSLGGRQILDGVDLRVGAAEIVGLIGSNGAGKTTLLRVLLGALRPTSGEVERPAARGSRGGIGYLPQKVMLDADVPLRARDVVALGLDGGRVGLPVRGRATRLRVSAALDAVGATAFADQRVGELSGGQQQRVLLAHALISEPSLLLLDEPLANLDPGSAHDVVQLLDELRRTSGIAIVVTAHDINLLLPVMDRVAFLAGGRAASGAPEEVIRSDVLSRLYGRRIAMIRAEGHVLVVADGQDAAPGPVLSAGQPRPAVGRQLA